MIHSLMKTHWVISTGHLTFSVLIFSPGMLYFHSFSCFKLLSL